MPKRKQLALVASLIGAALPLWSQSSAPSQPESTQSIPDIFSMPQQPRGLGIFSASVFTSYFSSGQGDIFTGATQNLPSDEAIGGSVTGGWDHPGTLSNTSIVYTLSYTGRVRYSSLDALNQSFAMNSSYRLGPRWTSTFAADAGVNNLARSLFLPAAYTRAARLPANFGDFSSAILKGSASNTQIAAELTGTPILDSPAQNLLYGTRVMNVGFQDTATYTYSPRTSFSFDAGVSRYQHLSDNSNGARGQSFYLVPRTFNENAGITYSHALSERTQFNATVASRRTTSTITDNIVTTTSVSLGRVLNPHWLVQGHVGVGVSDTLRTRFRYSQGPRYVTGGTVAYKAISNTLIAGFQSSISDQFGLGSSRSLAATGAWNWFRPDSRWSAQSSFAWNRFQGGSIVTGLGGWRAGGGVTRRLSQTLGLDLQYYYRAASGRFAKSDYSIQNHAVQVALVWTPAREAARGVRR